MIGGDLGLIDAQGVEGQSGSVSIKEFVRILCLKYQEMCQLSIHMYMLSLIECANSSAKAVQNKLYSLSQKILQKVRGREVKKTHTLLFVCVFLTENVKGTREVTQTAQFILNGLS